MSCSIPAGFPVIFPMRARSRNGDGPIDDPASNVCKKAGTNGYTETAGVNPAIGIILPKKSLRTLRT